MPDLINVTYARNNFSQIMDEVVETQQPKIIIRESQPEAVIIPYAQYQKQETDWKNEFVKIRASARAGFKEYLKKNKIKYPKTEKQMYAVIDKISGRA